MTHVLTTIRGLPRRMRVRKERHSPEARTLDFTTTGFEPMLPFRIRIEVAPGRTSTGSAMRAAQIQQKLERVGAAAWTVSVEGAATTVDAEVDPAQLRHAATLPFVRRISLS